MSKLKKFLDVSGQERRFFLEALVLHVWVGLLLRVIPFRLIPRLFAGPQSAVHSLQSSVGHLRQATVAKSSLQFEGLAKAEDQSQYEPVPMKSGVSGRQFMMIEKIRLAIQRAGRVSPWRNRCLVSSLAGRCMLRRRKISSEISLGMAKDADGKMTAHAWLISGGLEIVPSGGRFHELYQF